MTIDRLTALTAECPQCDVAVNFDTMPRVGQITICPSCRTRLEVAYLYPIMLDWADDVPGMSYRGDDDEENE